MIVCRLSFLFPLTLLFSFGRAGTEPVPQELPIRPPTNVEEVRQRLNGSHFKEQQQRWFFDRGEDLFPAFETILADPKSDALHVMRVAHILNQMKVDRRRFLESAILRLADSSDAVRGAVIKLIEQIGSERDTAPIVVLLSDKDSSVRYQAAKTLAAVGGRRDLVALDAWLKTGTGIYRDEDSLKHVKECRDTLEKRLKTVSKKD